MNCVYQPLSFAGNGTPIAACHGDFIYQVSSYSNGGGTCLEVLGNIICTYPTGRHQTQLS
jgi:hypothetical protein